MVKKMFDKAFYKGKTVFITGVTGFKGSWMSLLLARNGVNVVGYALKPPTDPSLFDLLKLQEKITFVEGDIRDLEKLKSAVQSAQPDIVIHMAAQPLVRESYSQPVYTYDVNVMGTVNILESIRCCSSVKSFVNVTTRSTGTTNGNGAIVKQTY